MTTLRIYLYAGAAVAIIAFVLWWDHSEIAKGEKRIRDEDAATLSEFQQRVATQIIADAGINKGAVDALKTENDRLRALGAKLGPVHVWVRGPAGNSCAVSTTAAAPGGTGSAAAPGRVLPAAPARDVGPGLEVDAELCDEVSARLRALQAREVKLQAENGAQSRPLQ